MNRSITLATALILVAGASPALAGIGKGASLLSIQVTGGVADLYDPSGVSSGYITAYDHSENGVQAQFWKMMADDYALAISGGIGFFGETDEPGDNAPPSSTDVEYKQSSFQFRVGGDRVVSVGERAVLYFGPGLEFWSGKAEFTSDSTTVETERITRISLSGRMGAIMMVGSNWGLAGAMGHKVGYASAEEAGAKATWWPSSWDAQGGVVFQFGGD